MRKQNKIFVWSVYFDASKSRSDGRRVPKNLAIASPNLVELQHASKRLGLQPEFVSNAAYPGCPWQKTGLLVLPKTEAKTKILKNIGKELSSLRR